MNEIKRADKRIFARAILNPFRLLAMSACSYVAYLLSGMGAVAFGFGLAVVGIGAGVYAVAVRNDFINKRFRNPEHKHLWDMVEDRLTRLRKALKLAPEHVRASMSDLPTRVERTAKQLYQSLRRADIVRGEIVRSEGNIVTAAFPFHVQSQDSETNELYVMADKNVAEYRRHFQGIAARVTRTEGQCAVFISALDSMRVQILGHRLVGEFVPAEKEDFLSAMADIRTQLNSINEALDELDLPTTAPPIAEEQDEIENRHG
jgi:hypothetical protein